MTTTRTANFTSSQIYRLMGSDAVMKTYIEEKRMEQRLGRQLEQDKSSSSAMWGTWLQHRVTNVLLPMDCKPTKNIRRVHSIIPNWTGAEDYLRTDKAGEIKCYELKKFCKAHDAATTGWETLKKVCPDIAWQIVSHVILSDKGVAELTLYVPYRKELSIIKDKDEWINVLTPEQFEDREFQYWISRLGFASDHELPYLLEGNYYPNLSSFTFEITDEDRLALTNRVLIAVKELTK